MITDEQEGVEASVYEKLVNLLDKDEERTRTKYSVSSLVNKVHLYDLVRDLGSAEAELTSDEADHRLETGFLQLAEVYRGLDSQLAHPSRQGHSVFRVIFFNDRI